MSTNNLSVQVKCSHFSTISFETSEAAYNYIFGALAAACRKVQLQMNEYFDFSMKQRSICKIMHTKIGDVRLKKPFKKSLTN